MTYVADHASALADVQAAGAAVTFTPAGGGTFTPGTGVLAVSTATAIGGYAIRAKGNPQTYRELGLSEAENPTLFFVPSIYGDRPVLAARVVFGGLTYAVKSIAPVAPDGTLIAARVIVGR